jgi:hypothetical protein
MLACFSSATRLAICYGSSSIAFVGLPGIDFTEVKVSKSISPSLDRCSRFSFFGLAGLLRWTNERKRYKEK